jgi:N6-adenosine-specific RNA methylase IME4
MGLGARDDEEAARVKYSVILADPPWAYNDRRGTRSDGSSTRFGVGVAHRYSRGVMSIDDICALDVSSIAAQDAYLFLWATWPTLPDALRVIEAWGFRYVTAGMIWAKRNPKNGRWFRGPGRYVPANTEPLLMGVRGRPITDPTGWKPCQVVEAPHPRLGGKIIHSRKPASVHHDIARWAGAGIELFATQSTSGWRCVGYDVTGRDIREDIAMIKWEE